MKKWIFLLIFFLVVILGIGCYLLFFRDSSNINVYDYYEGEQREDVLLDDMIYLWNEDNMPTEIIYLENNGSYFDDPGFRPYMSVYEVPEGVEVKGAVLISPGGAFLFRNSGRK